MSTSNSISLSDSSSILSPIKPAFCRILNSIDSDISLYRGEVNGEIVWPPKGINGFGYDPIFNPKGFSETFAEMSHSKKIFCDHRYEAFLKLSKEHLIDN